MMDELSLIRAFRLDLTKVLDSLCCDPLTFMYKNSLLSPRDEWFDAGPIDDAVAQMRFIMGFRIRRDFMFFKRDAVLYRCPFCNSELIVPLGYTDFNGAWQNPTIRMAKGIPAIKFSRTKLLKCLQDTKKACKGVWPPKD